MPWTLRGRQPVAVALAALLIAAVLIVLPSMSQTARSDAASTSSTIYGIAVGPDQRPVKVNVSLFTMDWRYISRVVSSSGGVYRMKGVRPGQYRLQVTDRTAIWSEKKLARTDVTIKVYAGRNSQRDVVLKKAARIYGTVKLGPRRALANGATVRVSNQYGASFETTTDKRGRFAIGGLPSGQKFTAFAWDKKLQWTGRNVWIGKVTVKKPRLADIRLKTKAGGYSGLVSVNGLPMRGNVWATVINRSTGQWWTAPIKYGDMSRFQGLYPGRYILQLPANGQTVAQNIQLSAIKSGRVTRIKVNAKAAPPKPKPSPTVSSTPTATPTPTGTPTSTPTATPTPTASPNPTASSTPTVTVTVTTSPSSSATSSSTPTAVPSSMPR